MNKIILSILLLSGLVLNLNADVQDYINKTIADWKSKNKTNNEDSDNGGGTADDGYLEKADDSDQSSISKQTIPKQTTNPKSKKTISKQTKAVKSVIPKGAKVVHLRSSLDVKIPKDKYAILDFPFNITSFDFKGLKSTVLKTKGSVVDLPDEASKEKDKIDSPIDFEQKGNRIIVNSKVLGSGQMIVWGGPYPVIIDLSVKNTGVEYYSFINTSDPNNEIELKKLENREHQKVLNILSVALYRDKVPKGYEKLDDRKVFDYKKENFQLVRAYTLVGKYYLAEKWFALNKDKKLPLNLYEEMFYTPDIYSVSILTDRVEPTKSTAIYIIRKKPN